jgi:preprotein translocase subunit YajC
MREFMMPLAVGLALGAPPPGEGAPNMFVQLLPLAAIFVIFYFLLIRPARTKQKALQAMLETLKPGDKVITSAGIHGTVVALADDVIQLRIADNVKVDFSKSSIIGKKE